MNKWIKSCSVAWLACFGMAISCSQGSLSGDSSAAIPLSSSSHEDAPAMLWTVSKGGATSYLFGTMHVSDPRITTLKPSVEAAFNESDAVYTELKESALELGVKVAKLGMLPAGTKLKDVIPIEMYEKLSSYVKSKKMSMRMIDGLRPWMVGMQLQMIDAMKYMKGIALDMQLTNRATKEGKEVGGVETVDEQIAALAYGTPEEQITLLGSHLDLMIEHDNDEKSQIDIMLENYLVGDIDALWQTAAELLDDASELELAAFDALLVNRNKNMAVRIDQRFRTHPESVTFFAFGALHFAGPESVNVMLKNMGYRVERVIELAE